MVKFKLNFNFLSVFMLSSMMVVVAISVFSLKSRDSSFACLCPCSRITTVTGTISSNPAITSKRNFYRCSFKVDSTENYSAKGTIMLLVPKELVEAHYPKKLYSAQSQSRQGVSHEGPSAIFESGARLRLNVSCLNEGDRLFTVKTAEFLGWKNVVSYIRANCRLNFKRLLVIWGESGGFLLALLSGSREYTEQFIADSFCLAGLSHILALSGMHVSIFSGVTEKLVSRFAGRYVTQILSLLSIFLFVWFAGLSPSLCRALISSIIAFICSLFCIKIGALDCLCAAFLIQIMIYPSDFSSVSFMLSYLSLCGILILSNLISSFLCPFVGKWLSGQLSASMGAIIFTSPLSAKIFGFITPIGIISTIFISPLVSWFLILGIFCVVLSLIFPFLSKPLGYIMEILYYIIRMMSGLFAKVPPIGVL